MYIYEDRKSTEKSNIKSMMSSGGNSAAHSNALHRSNIGLPNSLRSGIESLSGFSMENVRVHYNSSKPAKLQAYAYTQGTEIHVAPGHEKCLPHEAWHVVQQMQGRVKPTASIGNEAVNDSAALEHEADIMGRKAAAIEEAGEYPLQLKECTGRVSQLSHIHNVVPPAKPAPKLSTPDPNPTVVFESMAANEEAARNIFDETKRYPGNTICVFGLNRQLNGEAPELNPNCVGDEGLHYFRGFTFEWTTPHNVNPGDQYKMPFIEARTEVMSQAERIVNKIKPSGPHGKEKKDYSRDFVFRWIDGDAKMDTSYNIIPTLKKLADSEYQIVTGSYKWKTTASKDTMPYYCSLIETINECEHAVRAAYFEHIGGLPEFVDNRGGLNGFYLPETTLMMNRESHQKILRKIRSRQAASEILLGQNNLPALLDNYDAEELDGELRNAINAVKQNNNPNTVNALITLVQSNYRKDSSEFDNGEIQDKESMKMLKSANISRTGVYHDPGLTVYKPLKEEFNLNDGINYLGKGMLILLMSETKAEKNKFEQELRNMRQSVFQHFSLYNDNFKRVVERNINLVYSNYSSHYKEISDELRN